MGGGGTGKMTQEIKSFSYKHESQSLGLQHPHKSQMDVAACLNQCTGVRSPEASWLSGPPKCLSSGFSKRPCLHK